MSSKIFKMRTSVLLVLVSVSVAVCGEQKGPSSDSEFQHQPSNVTIPEGEPAVLKCMAANKAQLCRWYYLELGLKFFDKRVVPMLVKEFSPTHRKDCSIIIKQVRKVQEGQWLCQALPFQSSKFIMSRPATLRVITESESDSWIPPDDTPPRNGRREDGIDLAKEEQLEFESSNNDIIQDVFIHETAVLKCQVNRPIESCLWIMPGGENFTSTKDKDGTNILPSEHEVYKIIGNLDEGNCSMEITEVAYHNEGNWRCVVKTQSSGYSSQGPLLHLHILDHNTASKHTHDGTAVTDGNGDSVSFLVISLVIISGILFVIVLLLLMFLYRRLKGTSDETRRILQISPRSSIDLQGKMLPVTDLTSASVMAVEHRKKLPLYEEHFGGHYNQYLDMSGTGANSGDGYVMMPGSSIRSSTSSRTTLSTLSTLPIGRSRSASNSTTDSGIFPHLTTIIDNPSYNPDDAFHRKRLSRPESVYSNDHVYEEIKDKIDEIVSKMEKIPEADSPTYTNITEDQEGYLIPKKSPIKDKPTEHVAKEDLPVHITKTPLPDPNATLNNKQEEQLAKEDDERPPPYSTVCTNDLTPTTSTTTSHSVLDPEYSRVGNDTQEQIPDPMERYDIPRPVPRNDPMASYDVPRQNPSPVNVPTDSPVQTEVTVDGLSGIIV